MSTSPTAVSEFVATMTKEEMLAEILARLEEMNTQLRSLAEPSPPSASILTADTEEREAATISSALVSSPSSAPPQDADPGFQSGVTELSYIHRPLPEPPVTTNGSAEQASAPARGIPFAHDAGMLENHASLQVDITTSYKSVHGGSVLSYLAPICEAARAPVPVALSNPREKIHLQLVSKTERIRNMCLSRFSLPSSNQVLDLPTYKPVNELQDVTRATPIRSNEFLSAMHTRCSMQGHGSDEVTTLSLSLCAFSMTVVAIKSTLQHEENTSELLRIPLLLESVKLLSFGTRRMSILGVFKDWQEQPWPPPMLVEILGSQVEDSITELRPNPWPSFEHSVYLIHRVSYMLPSCDTNLQQLGNLTGFSIIWDVSILNLFADPSKCRVQWKPPWVSYVGRNIAGHCPISSLIMVFFSLIIVEENWKCMVYISSAVILEFWWSVALFQSRHNAILFDLKICKLSCGWIITGKSFNSTDGHERDGLAMQGDMAVGLVPPWYQQSSQCFHLLADTRRTMMHFNQDSSYNTMESKCIVRLPHCVISWDYMEHWFELLAGAIQLDLCNIYTIPTAPLNSVNNCPANSERYYCTFDVPVPAGRPLLCPPDTSNSSWKLYMNSSCMVTFDPGITFHYVGVHSPLIGNVGILLFYARSYGLLHTLGHGKGEASGGSLVLFMSKYEEKEVSAANQKSMHSVSLMHGHLFLWELNGSKKSIRATLLLISPWLPPSFEHFRIQYTISNQLDTFSSFSEQNKGNFKSEHQIFLDMMGRNYLREARHKITLDIEDNKVPWDLVTSIENRKWCRLLSSSSGVKERLMILQLFAFSGTSCSILQIVSASHSPVPWDPGISEVLQMFNITTHGLGANRVSRREVCQGPYGL